MERSARFPRPTAFLTRVPVLRVKSRRRVYSKVRTSAPEKEAPGKREESRPEGKRKTRKLKKKGRKKNPTKTIRKDNRFIVYFQVPTRTEMKWR